MYEKILLRLTADGKQIRGTSMDRDYYHWIEVQGTTEFRDDHSGREKGSGLATGRRTYDPLMFTKEAGDVSSPLLAQALTNNEVLEGTFVYFDKKTSSTPSFSISFSEGRVAGIQPTTELNDYYNKYVIDTVSIVYHKISWKTLDETHNSDRWAA